MASDDETLRQRALRLALEENPDLAGREDHAALNALHEAAVAIEARLRLEQELVEVRRQEFADRARAEGAQARQRREDENHAAAQAARLAAEAEREREARARRQQLAHMGPVRRWIHTHRLIAIVAAVVVLAGAAYASWSIFSEYQRSAALAACDADAFYPGSPANYDRELANAFVACPSADVRIAVATNATPGTLTEDSLLSLAQDDNVDVVRAMLTEGLPASVVEVLASSNDPAVQKFLVTSHWNNLSTAAINALYERVDDPDVQRALLRRYDHFEAYASAEAAVRRWVDQGDPNVLISIAETRTTPVDILQELAQNSQRSISRNALKTLYPDPCEPGAPPDNRVVGSWTSARTGDQITFLGDCTLGIVLGEEHGLKDRGTIIYGTWRRDLGVVSFDDLSTSYRHKSYSLNEAGTVLTSLDNDGFIEEKFRRTS